MLGRNRHQPGCGTPCLVLADETANSQSAILTDEDTAFRDYIRDISCRGRTAFQAEHLPLLRRHAFPVLEGLARDGLVRWNEQGSLRLKAIFLSAMSAVPLTSFCTGRRRGACRSSPFSAAPFKGGRPCRGCFAPRLPPAGSAARAAPFRQWLPGAL